ncbi:MAG: hypothetical protein ACD_11C00030G0003 [uncultured bacterium]|nr:MAG: hypothetical protein ACD_11C00030G0003 [uncultured bacterium]HBR72010.1 glutamyl-tRNA amidotransferase [Candidatus Moranbacteria bacterium]
MSLKEKILFDLKAAMKEGDAFKRDTLRLLDSAIKNIEIEKKKREEGLNDEEVVEVLSRAMKQRQDSILQFEKGGRPDLAEKEKKEVEIISCYLPKQLSAEEAQKKILEVIEKSGASSVSDFGKVMGQVMAELKGKFDGNLAKEIVKQELEKMQK